MPHAAGSIPWDGPRVHVIEHPAHAPGHAALLLEGSRVLIAGDMLSDLFVPFLDTDAADPVEDYLTGLDRLEEAARHVDLFVPGHGSIGGIDELRARLDIDRSFVQALRDGGEPDDPRIG